MCAAEHARRVPIAGRLSELSDAQASRAARQIALPGFGEESQRRLAAARVLVIGAGGLGSASIPYLTGAGVGTIGVIDDDVVEISNLHRQIAHGTDDLGRAKVDSLAESVARIDPNVRIRRHGFRLTAENARELFSAYDLIIDGSDNFATRYLANDAAQLTDTPLVWGAILQYHGQVSVAWHRYGPGYRDLFPVPPAPGDVLSCGEGGVLPGLCGTVGSLLATEAMKLITGIGDPLIGRVLTYDSLAARTRELVYERDPAGRAVTGLIDYEQFCSGGAPKPQALDAEELAQLLHAEESVRLLDVRDVEEHKRSKVCGATLLPLPDLEAAELAGTVATIVPSAVPVVVHCEHDPRSIRAAQILQAAGVPSVRYLKGGMQAFASVAPEFIERTHNG